MRIFNGIIVYFLIAGIISCESPKDIKIDEISKLEQQLDSSKTFNRNLYNDLIKNYIDFTEKYPDDTIVPHYLFKAANIARSLSKGREANRYYQKIEKEYPDFVYIPMTIFFQAVVYEDLLHNLNKAEENYNRFIKKYPKHPFADDAKILVKNLGKSPEELIKSFEKKNKDQNSSK